MATHCCEQDHQADGQLGRYWRMVLWIALAINTAMFVTEIVAGVVAGSVSLHADALDFLGDAANYAVSLAVVGLVLTWRARAALLKGLTLVVLGLWVIGETAWHVAYGGLPEASMMGLIGVLALLANGVVALMLFRFRASEANMRSVWICSRNDVLGNAAVLLAALGVFGTGTLWPDVIVAGVMATLSIHGGASIIRQASVELGARPAYTKSR
jgi:Co/Zn/Cd efflux system component